MKNIVNSNIYSIHYLCDDIIMTSTFVTNVACNLSNTITSHFSCKGHLQLKIIQTKIENMKKNSSVT